MNTLRGIRSLFTRGVVCVFLACPAWAQGQASGPSKRPSVSQTPKAKDKGRAAADITAQLQADAVAQAAVRAKQAAGTAKMALPAGSLPAVSAQGTELPGPATRVVPDSAGQVAQGAVQATPQDTPELLIAQQIHQGQLPCEMGATIRIEADALHPGYFHVHGKGFRYRMFPVQTSTGALRLEDKKAGAVWLQLANKSMLMDQKKGRRIADACAHPDQLAYAETMKTNPPPSLIDTTGMGR